MSCLVLSADGYNLVCMSAGIVCFGFKYLSHDEAVVFGVAQEYQVMYSHYGFASCLMQTHRKFIAKAMKDINLLSDYFFGDSPTPPPFLPEGRMGGRIDKRNRSGLF